MSKLIAETIKLTEFCRDWRNRRIAHRDLKLALEQPTTPLAAGSRAQAKDALKAIANVLNARESLLRLRDWLRSRRSLGRSDLATVCHRLRTAGAGRETKTLGGRETPAR